MALNIILLKFPGTMWLNPPTLRPRWFLAWEISTENYTVIHPPSNMRQVITFSLTARTPHKREGCFFNCFNCFKCCMWTSSWVENHRQGELRLHLSPIHYCSVPAPLWRRCVRLAHCSALKIDVLYKILILILFHRVPVLVVVVCQARPLACPLGCYSGFGDLGRH